MISYFLKCRKKTQSKNQRIAKTIKRKPTLLSKLEVCYREKLRFIKDHEASDSLSSLAIKTSSDKIPLNGPTLFSRNKMNNITYKFLLA